MDSTFKSDSSEGYIRQIRTDFAASPKDDFTKVQDRFTSRVRGYFVPPSSDFYRFLIRSDDNSLLYFSNTTSPKDKVNHDNFTFIIGRKSQPIVRKKKRFTVLGCKPTTDVYKHQLDHIHQGIDTGGSCNSLFFDRTKQNSFIVLQLQYIIYTKTIRK